MNAFTRHRLPLDGTIRPIVLAVSAVLSAHVALGAESAPSDEVKALTTPGNAFEVGLGGVSDDSFKFGEYNGLEDQGAFLIGSLALHGGGRYNSDDATRWTLTATNLGLSTRKVAAEYGRQGVFRVTLGYDELRRNRSDSYTTPYLGAGSDVLTLPSSWLVPVVPRLNANANARGLSAAVSTSSALVNGVLTAPTPAQLTTANALLAADLPLFAQHDLYTTRSRVEAGISYLAPRQWEIAVNANRMDKTGAKPMGSVTRITGADISSILADPIDQTTDQFTVTLAKRTRQDFLQLSYYGSKFTNHIDSLTWTNWANPASSMTMSSAPSNQAHTLSLNAGHDFTRSTRVVLTGAYGRNTQNAVFLTDTGTPLVPTTSLDGLVVTQTYNLKLTSRPTNRLNLGLAYKFDERDNRTAVHTFAFYDANEPAGTTAINSAFSAALGLPASRLASNANVNASRPYSRRMNQATADATLRLSPGQSLRGAYEWQSLDRWCEGSWIACADADNTKENTWSLEWRANLLATLQTRLSLSRSERDVGHYNEDAFLALVPMANVAPSSAIGGVSAYAYMLANALNGYGPTAGLVSTTGNQNLYFPLNNALANTAYANQNRISELAGLRRYNMADRTRDRIKAVAEWQPTEVLALHANADYRKDDFTQSRYGLIDSRSWSANFEGSVSATEDLSVTLFYTFENQRARSAGNTYTANSTATAVNGFTAIPGGCFPTIALRNASNKIDPCLDWSTSTRDRTSTYGFTADRKNLAGGKLALGLELLLSRTASDNDVTGGNYVNNPLAVTGAPAGTLAAYYLAAAPLPTVKTQRWDAMVNARYALTPASTLRFDYRYAWLRASDYAYEGMQFGGLAGVLPTSETAPHYSLHVASLSYQYRF
ncbi:MAG: MtrB/PioB family decaheme-associated outer membrane protein [Steroidobacteraceae bacterium]